MSSVSGQSQALVPYNPEIPQIRSFTEAADRAAKNQIEANRLAPVLPAVSGNIRHSGLFFTPPEGLNTDLFIGVEIYRPDSDEKKPILIFSHGMGADPVQYRPLLKELASQGYVVLSITHPSAVEDLPLPLKEERARVEKTGYVMANNIRYVLDQVKNGGLRGVGDAGKIVLAGHSLGGAASINVARNDPSIAGCVNLDGFLHGEAKTAGVKQPLLMMIGDYKDWAERMKQNPEEEAREYADHVVRSLEEYDALQRNSSNAEKIVIPGGAHMDFTDVPFRDLMDGKKSLDSAMRVHTMVSKKMLQFMNSATSATERRCCSSCTIQ